MMIPDFSGFTCFMPGDWNYLEMASDKPAYAICMPADFIILAGENSVEATAGDFIYVSEDVRRWTLVPRLEFERRFRKLVPIG